MTASELQPTHQRTQVGQSRVVNSFNGESNQEASPFRQNSNDIIAENLAKDNKELCMLLEEIPQCLDIKEIQTCITIVEEDQQRTIE